MTGALLVNPHATPESVAAPPLEPARFHQTLPGYAPTPLVCAERLASQLDLSRVWVKQESARIGLPAFKILGASWATHQALGGGLRDQRCLSLDWLSAHVATTRWTRLAAATDGNHGRAVARMAGMLGLECRIFVPAGTTAARIDAIESEGARVDVVAGSYDESVMRAAAEADDECAVISDTPCMSGGEETARWAVEGYATILCEVESELTRLGAPGPDVIIVQVGTGGLAAAVVRHFRRAGARSRPLIVAVEPEAAACARAAAQAGRVVTIPAAPTDSIMAGLNCGTVSSVAWPLLASGVDAFLSISDDRAIAGMRAFADAGIVAGETGAAGLGGLLTLLERAGSRDGRAVTLDGASTVLLFCTEGATDPGAYARLVDDVPGSPG